MPGRDLGCVAGGSPKPRFPLPGWITSGSGVRDNGTGATVDFGKVEVTGAADVAAGGESVAAGEAEVDAIGVWETTGVAEEAVGAAGVGEADAWETAGTLAEGGARAGEGARTGGAAETVAAGEGVEAGGTLDEEAAVTAGAEVGAADPVGRAVVVVVVVGLIAVEVTGFAGPGASLDMWTTAAALMSPVPEIIAFLRIVNEHLNGHDTFRAYLTSRLDCGRFFVLFLLLLDRSKSPRLEFGVSYSSCRGVLSQARIVFDQLIGIQGQQGRPLTFNNRTSKGLL